jgi:hypothetical protein
MLNDAVRGHYDFSRARACQKHFFRIHRYGDPYYVNKRGTPQKGRAAREHAYLAAIKSILAENTEIVGDCLVWTGSRDLKGYGHIYVTGAWGQHRKKSSAHRASYLAFVGAISDGLYVCHHCDNPPCVKPEHLFLGTARENSHDMWAKGRHGRGAKRLTEGAVKEMRSLAAGGMTCTALAAQFGVAISTVSTVIRRKAWRHIE